MLAIKIEAIPAYLRNGALYHNLITDSNGDELTVPANCFRQDPKVSTDLEVDNLLKALRFWIVKSVPTELLDYVILQGNLCLDTFLIFEKEIPYLHAIHRVAAAENRICEAFTLGNLEIVKYLHEVLHEPISSGAVQAAATHGHENCLIYAFHSGFASNDQPQLAKKAAGGGYLNCLKYLLSLGNQEQKDVCSIAALNGHLDCLTYAHEIGCSWNYCTPNSAAREGHLDCLVYALQNGCNWTTFWYEDEVCKIAAGNGHLECLTFAHNFGCQWDSETSLSAVRGGQLSCLRYLHENGCPWDSHAGEKAAASGNWECLQYAHEQGCYWGFRVSAAAARMGQLECLRYALEHSCVSEGDYDSELCTIAAAAERNSIECLQYLREFGCFWDDRTCRAAAEVGNLPCLVYLHTSACPWDVTSYWAVVARKHPACVEYLLRNGCPGYDLVCGGVALGDDNLWLLQIAHKLGLPWTPKTLHYAQQREFEESVKFLMEHGCPTGV